MSQIGAYFQCHKQPYATFKALESFRKYYPDSTIILVSDNGYDYTEMAKLFNCTYIFQSVSTPMINKIDHQWGVRFIQNIRNYFELIKEPYIFWLEDDIILHGAVPIDELKYTLNGFCPNSLPIEVTTLLSKQYASITPGSIYRWTGHGGSVYNKQQILEILGNCNTIVDDLICNWNFYKLTINIVSDYFLSLLINISGGSIGPYKGHLDADVDTPSIIIQHQYKKYYNIPLPDNLTYLIKL